MYIYITFTLPTLCWAEYLHQNDLHKSTLLSLLKNNDYHSSLQVWTTFTYLLISWNIYKYFFGRIYACTFTLRHYTALVIVIRWQIHFYFKTLPIFVNKQFCLASRDVIQDAMTVLSVFDGKLKWFFKMQNTYCKY